MVPVLTMPAGDITHPAARSDRLHHRGTDRARPRVAGPGVLPVGGSAVLVVPADASWRRSRGAPGRPSRRRRPAALRAGPRPAGPRLAELVGDDGLTEPTGLPGPRTRLPHELVDQGRHEERTIDDTLDRVWKVLARLPHRELSMLPSRLLEAHLGPDPTEAGQHDRSDDDAHAGGPSRSELATAPHRSRPAGRRAAGTEAARSAGATTAATSRGSGRPPMAIPGTGGREVGAARRPHRRSAQPAAGHPAPTGRGHHHLDHHDGSPPPGPRPLRRAGARPCGRPRRHRNGCGPGPGRATATPWRPACDTPPRWPRPVPLPRRSRRPADDCARWTSVGCPDWTRSWPRLILQLDEREHAEDALRRRARRRQA